MYLCFLLIGELACYHPVQHIERTQQVVLTNTWQDYTVLEDDGLNKEPEYLIRQEVEGEEEDNALARKDKWLNAYNPVLYSTFIANYCYSRSKDRLPFCSHLSYKHAIQISLRI